MEKIFGSITILAGVLSFVTFGIAVYMNIWIYYSASKEKFPFFPLVNPVSMSSYELMVKSMFKFNWKEEGMNKKHKLRSNQLRKLSGVLLLLTLFFGILTAIVG